MNNNKSFNWGRFTYFVVIVFLALPFLLSVFIPLFFPTIEIDFIDKTISGMSLLLSIIGTIVGLITFNSTKEDAERQDRTDVIVAKLDVVTSKLEKEVAKINNNLENISQENINSIRDIHTNGDVNINYSISDSTMDTSKQFAPPSDAGENGEAPETHQETTPKKCDE